MGDVDRYLISARQAGLSRSTIRQYEWHLKRMAGWLQDRGAVHTCAVSRDLVREWGASLRDDWGPATVKQAVGAARAFFRWCASEGRCFRDLADVLLVPRVPRRVQRTISLDEARLMLSACDNSAKGLRDAALILTLVDTALRAAEVCRLTVDDLEMDRLRLAVVVKGGDRSAAHFGAATARRLRDWLEVRPGVALAGERAVFVSVGGSTPGRSLTVRGLRSVLKGVGESVGLVGVTTHAFRRGFAVISQQAGAPSRAVMAAGRWSRIEMVERYSMDWERSMLYERWSPGDLVDNSGV